MNLEKITKNSYNKISNWDEKRRYLWRTTQSFLQKFKEENFKKLKDIKILDVGCGGGRNLEFCEKLGFDKKNLFGIDYSITQVKKISEKKFNGKVCDMKNIEFENKLFDLLICEASFHHLLNYLDMEKCLKEFKRISKNNCLIFLSLWMPNKDFLEKNLLKKKFEFIDKNKKIVKVKYNDLNQNKSFDRYYYFFEKKEIKDLIKKNNFKISEESYDDKNYYLVFKNNCL